MAGNNIYIGQDPVLSGGIDYSSQLNELERLKAAIEQKQQALKGLGQQVAQQAERSSTPVWDEIDSIVSGLSDKEFEMVTNNPDFVESQQKVMNILQAVYMKMMRPMVEATKEGKEALESHLAITKQARRLASKEVDAELEDFKTYKERYSSMSYADYQKMKGGKK